MQTVFERRGVISTVFERRGVISSAFERYERPMDQLWFSVETARLEARANPVEFQKEQPLQLVVDPALLQITASEVAFEKESPLELAVDTARLDVTASEVEFSIVEADQEFHVDGALLELTANEVVFSKEQPLEFAVDTARVEATAAEVTFDREEPLSLSVDTARLDVTASEVSFDTADGQTLEVDTAQLAVTASEVTFDKEEPLELVVDTARLEVTASEVEFEPEGGSNPYYDADADFYYELSDANDSNGGAHLSNTNSVLFTGTGRYGNCATFDGTNYLTDNTGTIGPAWVAAGCLYTLEMHVRFPALNVDCGLFNFVSFRDCAFIRATGNIEMRRGDYNGGSGSYDTLTSNFWSGKSTNTWYKLTFQTGYISGGLGMRMYLDDVLLNSSDGVSRVSTASTGFDLGTIDAGSFLMRGDIDEVKITLGAP